MPSLKRDCDHLLIDARNLLYRAIYAGIGDPHFNQSGHNLFVVVIRFVHEYLNIYKPKHIHIFWDGVKSTLWRRKVLSTYKLNRGKVSSYRADIRPQLREQTELCIAMFPLLGMRQYYTPSMEADDLIYAFCRMNPTKEIVIVSSDSDFRQIPFRHGHVRIFNPLKRSEAIIPDYDPVLMKSLTGDKADNILGYYGLGEKRAMPLILNQDRLFEFFDSQKACVMEAGQKVVVGPLRFQQNMAVIDMSLCPGLIENMIYTGTQQRTPASFDQAGFRDMINQKKVRGMIAEINSHVIPFKQLVYS